MKQPQRSWKSFSSLLFLGLGLSLAGCASSEPVSPAADGGKGGSPNAGAPSGGSGGSGGGKAGSAAVGGGGKAGEAAGHGGGTAGSAAGSGGSAPIMRATRFDAGSDPARNKVSAQTVCKRLSEINCAGEAFCCDSPGRSVDTCKADILKTCSQELMLDLVAQNPITGFDAADAERAFAELEAKAGKCDPSVAAWGSSQQGLRGLLHGTVAPDGNCMPQQSLPDAPSIAAALLSCSGNRACLYDSPLSPWTCAPRGAAGAACVTDNNCQDGLYCLLPALAVNGSCMDRKATGESCVEPRECKTLFCKQSKCVDADQQAAYCLVN